MKTELFSMRLSPEVKDKLERLASATGRSKSYIANKAIEKYCDLMIWQVSAVNKAILQADEDDMISQEDLRQEWMYK